MFSKESIPFAPALIESMRSLGYSFESAIADLIDNSISANSKHIQIFMNPVEDPYLIIFDDGHGMDEYEIEEAMRYGSKNPLETRNENDLGRFGLGLKSASLSQCRKLVVVSKKNKKISAYSWDLDYVIENGSWSVIGYSENEIQEFPKIDLLDVVDTGTYILLQKFDRVEVSTSNLENTLKKHMDVTIDHLSLVFHRYLDDGLNIYVNNEKIEQRDPFLTTHKRTQLKRTQSFNIDESTVFVKPYILPHAKYLKTSDIKKVGSKEQFKNEQGFYVYRNKRLIIWGTWFRLERKNELSKLARVMVDIPNSLDYMWNIDIKKSSASLPDKIKQKLYNAAENAAISSENVYSYRGRKTTSNTDISYVWERIKSRDGYEYKINKDIPHIKMLEQTLNDDQLKLLDRLIENLEKNFPVNSIYLDVSKGDVNELSDDRNTSELLKEIETQLDYARSVSLDTKSIIDVFIKTEPYCKDFNLVKILNEMRDEEGVLANA
ncbi:MAG: ATP-binding protein [Paraclostridium sp.]|uniref:ATP-binding protein n=1 Tax=Paraclostridium sp. TaxID=2023273 RepID=UPI003F364257